VNDSLEPANNKGYISFFARMAHKLRIDEAHHIIETLPLKKRMVFWGLFWISALSLVLAISFFNERFLARIPTYGGSFSEGMIGRPAFINPVLALSDTDKVLETLVYSGLLRKLPSGELVPDLAETITLSEDGKTYTVTLKEGMRFHDGKPVTADDVLFTINKIKDPLFKSPERGGWEGVTASKTSDTQIIFSLTEAYALFPENLTVGILPEAIWKEYTSVDFNNNPYNLNAIGTGPYKVGSVRRGANGIIEAITLTAFNNFALGKPRISKISFSFYDDEEALVAARARGAVDAISGMSPKVISTADAHKVAGYPLARVFAVFLNQNKKSFFADRAVREALAAAMPKDKIITDIFNGYATPLTGPLSDKSTGTTTATSTAQDARALLEEDKWVLNDDNVYEKGGKELSFSLATANIADLKDVASLIATSLTEVGVRVEVKVYEVGDLNQEVIRPRDYDALLFGEVVGREPDLFAFWHSSQRFDPGLNVALYTNPKVDKLLSEARSTADGTKRQTLYQTINEEIAADVPALFLYSPLFLYEKPAQVKNIQPFTIAKSADRFVDIHTWYINEDKVWGIFAPR
jgi:peptide/nickel transport system substrate-binding protein